MWYFFGVVFGVLVIGVIVIISGGILSKTLARCGNGTQNHRTNRKNRQKSK